MLLPGQGIIPYCVSRAVLLFSTSKDPTIGDVTPVSSAEDLTDRLLNKRAIVVGGTRGIGRGIALTLSRAGANVAIVGRNTSSIVAELEDVMPIPRPANGNRQVFTAHPADLYTIAGGRKLVDSLAEAKVEPFDYVFFTVGCWPNYTDPFTPDGIEKTVALDLVARHVVLTSLIRHKLLKKDARVMSTLASTQSFPFQSSEGVRKRLVESTELVPPGKVPFTLMPVGLAGDAWLREASRRWQDIHFIGTFPGIVSTDVAITSFPSWMASILRVKLWLVGMTEEEAGLAHVTVMASDNVGRNGVSFYNHVLEARHAHRVSMDNGLAEYVFDWLEKTCTANGRIE